MKRSITLMLLISLVFVFSANAGTEMDFHDIRGVMEYHERFEQDVLDYIDVSVSIDADAEDSNCNGPAEYTYTIDYKVKYYDQFANGCNGKKDSNCGGTFWREKSKYKYVTVQITNGKGYKIDKIQLPIIRGGGKASFGYRVKQVSWKLTSTDDLDCSKPDPGACYAKCYDTHLDTEEYDTGNADKVKEILNEYFKCERKCEQ